jgi:very-short-patch-repair endonuclease
MVTNPTTILESDPVRPRLEAARRDLLDLGLRNALLNYRPLKSRGVDVVDELPAEIFRLLVVEGKTLVFQPAPEATQASLLPTAADSNLDVDDADLPAAMPAERHTDKRLQTPCSPDELRNRLLNTYYAARTAIEEQGVNILFLALGMLEWYESDASQEPRRAPLLLVPVELQRQDARDRFHLAYTGEDVGDNLSLTEKLLVEFGVRMPELPEVEDLNADAYFVSVAAAVASYPRWRVDAGAIALGFFSFGKFLMYHDLDLDTWPKDADPSRHAIMQALFGDGFNEPPLAVAEDAFLDHVPQARELRVVVDADSSQTLAILDVNSGRNLVIQGPPGTGKSQTITNLIAETIGAGKTVLFVAEKMAALEVVKRRLDSIGLGEACLELHSHKINKKRVLAGLQRTLELGKPRLEDREADLSMLEATRERLNAYADAVNTPIDSSGVTPYQAYGDLVQLGMQPDSATWPRLELPDMATWSAVEYRQREALVEELQARLARMGVPSEHPFWGVRRTTLLAADRRQVADAISLVLAALADVRAAAAPPAAALGMAEPDGLADAERLYRATHAALHSPSIVGLSFAEPDWLGHESELRELLANGTRLAELRAKHAATVIPEAWQHDLLSLRQDLNAYRDTWWRIVSGTYRRAKRVLAGYCTTALPKGIEAQIQLLDDLVEARRLATYVQEHALLGERMFGPHWRGDQTDWPLLGGWLDAVTGLQRDVSEGRLPRELLAYLDAAPDIDALGRLVAPLDAALPAYRERTDALLALVDFDGERRFGPGGGLERRPFAEQASLLATWQERLDDLSQMTSLNESLAVCRREGLDEVGDVAQRWSDAGRSVLTAFRRGRAAVLLGRALREREPLARFDGGSHEQVVERFRRLDELHLQRNRALIALEHYARVPRHEGGGQLALLRREFVKRARHLSVRRLMAGAGNAIQAIKPVFMMSPLSVATYLPPGALSFDLVVFDEASQVRPVDAFGALIRGAQAVVVGDSKQLPPTSFFDALVERDGLDDEEAITRDIQSILELFYARGAPQRMLRWHYRSRHESLIAVSNHEFYEDKLVVFPSPDAGRWQAGLVYHHLTDTSYARGGSRTNAEEAHIVAEAVMRHARTTPELTLGVASFSVAQTQAIIDQIERLRVADPTAEPFFARHPHEPFFVKNLENVQGDERDVIFISVGYGRDANGYLAMNFGPLNAAGGERRLNVLITRARSRCEVFTNLTADDIDLVRSEAHGVVALKRFLKYAQTGILDVPRASGREAGSPFEEAVEAELARAGYTVERQVGSAGFFIDLAVVDPDRPGRYLLGIECDGASYHSARSARDRDRLRQQVLEKLGWRIHRIWSTDWFRSRERELARVVQAIEDAAARGDSGAPLAPPTEPPAIERLDDEMDPVSPIAPYVVSAPAVALGGLELHAVAPARWSEWIEQVVEIESPIHSDEVVRRVAAAAGVGRVGNRIRATYERGVEHALRRGRVRRLGDFLWSASSQAPVPRRRDVHGAPRDIDLIAPEELALAIDRVVRDAFGMPREQIPVNVCRLLGFQRMTAEMRATLDPIIDAMLADDRLAERGGHVVVPDTP